MLPFNGINYYSRQPEVLFDFYKRLGLRVLEEVSPDSKWYGARLALSEDAEVPMIWIWRQTDDSQQTSRNHLVFTGNGNLDEVYAQIRSAGIVCDPPFTADWGGRELILRDPDGNELLYFTAP